MESVHRSRVGLTTVGLDEFGSSDEEEGGLGAGNSNAGGNADQDSADSDSEDSEAPDPYVALSATFADAIDRWKVVQGGKSYFLHSRRKQLFVWDQNNGISI